MTHQKTQGEASEDHNFSVEAEESASKVHPKIEPKNRTKTKASDYDTQY